MADITGWCLPHHIYNCAECQIAALRAEVERLNSIYHGQADPVEAKRLAEAQSLTAYLTRQWGWSARTFGPGRRTKGILQHIRKELLEVEAKPDDLSEWVDVAILAMDGFWRHGGDVDGFMPALLAKQEKNFARQWPEPTSEDHAIEHVRDDAALDVARREVKRG